MSVFRASLLIDGDGSGARAEVENTSKAVKGLGTASEATSRDANRLAAATDNVEAQARAAAAAQRDAAVAAKTMGTSQATAARNVGNLTAQFNDIGVMLAAGQNPLQLAIQQGTQITQVIGPMGAAGAVRALGQGFLAMLSPINLVTIGALAAGAAITQWLFDAGDGADDFESGVSDLADAVDAYAEAARKARQPTADLNEEFGRGAGAARDFLEETLETRRRDAGFSAAADIRELLENTDLDLPRWGSGDQGRLGKLFDLNPFLGSGRQEARELINPVLDAYANLSDAADASVEEQISALSRLIVAFKEAAEASGSIDTAENAQLKEMLSLLTDLNRLRAEDEQVEADKLEHLKQSYELYAATRAESDAELAKGREMLATLQEQNAIAQATRVHGAESVQVAELRAQAERRALQAQMDALGVSADLQAAITAAADEAYRLATTDIASGIWDAANAASAMAANLANAIVQMNDLRIASVENSQKRAELALSRLNTVGDPVARAGNEAVIDYRYNLDDGGYGLLTSGRAGELANAESQVRSAAEAAAALEAEASAADKAYRDLLKENKGGGGRTKAEADAIADLIASLEDELAILKETDPVRKELLKHRETLAEATDAERQKVEELIRARIEEQRAAAAASEMADFFSQTLYDGIRSIAFEGGSAIEVLENLTAAIAEAALQAALLGTGPLANLFGTADSGGALGMIFGAIFGAPGKAEGGWVEGPGTGTSDDVPHMLSNGEFVVRAAAAAKNAPLLEAINAGVDIADRLPKMAAGGWAGAPPPPPPPANIGAPMGAVAFSPRISVENHGSQPLDARMEEIPGEGGQRAYRLVLSDQVGAALTQPGGDAPRTLRNAFGVRRTGTRR